MTRTRVWTGFLQTGGLIKQVYKATRQHQQEKQPPGQKEELLPGDSLGHVFRGGVRHNP